MLAWADKSASVIAIAGGEKFNDVQAEIRDLSPCGIRITTSFPFQVGDQFVMTLVSSQRPTVHVLYRVVHARHDGEGELAVGAEYMCVVSVDKDEPWSCIDEERVKRAILS
jgi:hypothetical protein